MSSAFTRSSPESVPAGLTLLIGGARSGKSDLAVRIGTRHEGLGCHGVVFIATAQRFDDDMTERIAHHQAERPPWPTLEAPLDLLTALDSVPAGHLAIVDCLTLWVSNMVLADWSDDEAREVARKTALAASNRCGPTVVVTNEVGLGIHPDAHLGRRYRDLLGRVNCEWADHAMRSVFLVAGRALPLHDPWEFLT